MKIKPSGVRRIFDLARQMKDPINLSIGEPDFDIPEPLKDEGIKWIKKGFNKYTPTQGIPELRERIADHLKKKGVHFEEFMVTAGVTGGPSPRQPRSHQSWGRSDHSRSFLCNV